MSSKKIGRVCLILAMIIFAASNSISSKLADIGMQNSLDGRNPISFCNVLFIGNLSALVTLSIVYGRKWNPRQLNRLSLANWLILIGAAILVGTVAPALTFFALEKTSATNVILIGRIQSPITLALFTLAGDKKTNWWIFVGEIVAVLGIICMLVLETPEENFANIMGQKIGIGELLAIAGALALSLGKFIRGTKLNQISLGVWAIFRTAIGTVVFATLVIKLFSISHFTDVFNPLVWQWISIYGIIIVAGGQILWFKGLSIVEFSAVSYAGYLIPLAGMAIAYFILGEIPTAAQYVGMFPILIGAIVNQIGVSKSFPDKSNHKFDVERLIQFKGI